MNRLILIFLLLMYPSCDIVRAADLKASWYSCASLVKEGTWKNGKPQPMANGKLFRDAGLTAASRDYDLNSFVVVTNLENGKSVKVKITDRIGKRFAGKRIDLSKRAFSLIADLDRGIVPVKVRNYESSWR